MGACPKVGQTNASGQVSLALGATTKKLERLWAFPGESFWGALRRGITVKTGTTIQLVPTLQGKGLAR